MFNKSEIEQQVAEFLLQIKAIKLQPDNPFTWASGWKSPIIATIASLYLTRLYVPISGKR